MKLSQKIRHYWHELYYFLATKGGVEFALRCQKVAEEVDLTLSSTSLKLRLRYSLHLSLCQACQNYFDSSKCLRQSIRNFVMNSEKSANIEHLNKKLLKRFGR